MTAPVYKSEKQPMMGSTSKVGFTSPAPVKTAPNATKAPSVIDRGKC